MKTTATTEPRRVTVPVEKSESQVSRRLHSARASRPSITPSWPWPPLRLVDRRYDLDTVTCPTCHGKASFRRSWCTHCGSTS